MGLVLQDVYNIDGFGGIISSVGHLATFQPLVHKTYINYVGTKYGYCQVAKKWSCISRGRQFADENVTKKYFNFFDVKT